MKKMKNMKKWRRKEKKKRGERRSYFATKFNCSKVSEIGIKKKEFFGEYGSNIC